MNIKQSLEQQRLANWYMFHHNIFVSVYAKDDNICADIRYLTDEPNSIAFLDGHKTSDDAYDAAFAYLKTFVKQ